MHKKIKILFIIIMLFAASALTFNVYATDDFINHADVDGSFKVYYNFPVSVAATKINGVDIVITGDMQPSRLAIYTDDNGAKNAYEVLLDEGANPAKLEIFNNFLFVYDSYHTNKLSIFDLSVPSAVTFLEDFNLINSINDFSIAGDTMYILAIGKVTRYNLTADDGLAYSIDTDYNFSAINPQYITAIDEHYFIYIKNNQIFKADLSGTAPIIIINNTYGVNARYFNDILYYLNINTNQICSFDTINSTKNALPLYVDERPQSFNITFADYIYVNNDGVYIVDKQQKKIVRYNSDFSYSGFCLSSSSYDEGRFFSPKYVSTFSGGQIVCDKNRIQIFDGTDVRSLNINFLPEYAFLSEDTIFTAYNNQIYIRESYTIDETFIQVQMPSEIVLIKDIKLSSDQKLYILSDTALYTMDKEGIFIKLFNINDGLKLSVNIKTKKVYILTDDKILIFHKQLDNEYYQISSVDVTNEYQSIETDFEGNIYLLCEQLLPPTDTNPAIIKIEKDLLTSSVYILNEMVMTGLNSLAIDFLSGDVYFVSKNAHAIFKIDKNEMDVGVASDIPSILLSDNPENADSADFISGTLIINGYPSTMFYPFDILLKNDENYPLQLAYEQAEILEIPSGTKLLYAYETQQYFMVFYNGKLGFVLKDNTQKAEDVSPLFVDAETLLKSDVYNIPYFLMQSETEKYFVKDTIDKWTKIKVLYELEPYLNSAVNWLYVEYEKETDKKYGYINKANITQYFEPQAMSYIIAKAHNKTDIINLFKQADDEEVLYTLINNSEIKIYYTRGEYSFISVLNENNEEIYGYILSGNIPVDYTFLKQKIGFMMIFGTIGVAILFVIIKRKFFY